MKINQKKNGRPCKATLDEKKVVVNSFFAAHPNVAHSRGIFRRLAEHAQATGFSLYDHDFSKDSAIRSYIEQKLAACQSPCKSNVMPMYEPVDIDFVCGLRGKRLAEWLQQRETYFSGLYNQAVVAIESHKSMLTEITLLKSKLDTLTQSIDDITNQKAKVEQEVKVIRQENQKLRHYIRKELTPERAEAYFQRMSNPSVAIEQARLIVNSNIREIGDALMDMQQEQRIDFTKKFI